MTAFRGDRSAILIFISAAFLVLSGCGLESFVVLSEPQAELTAPAYTFQFRKLFANGEPGVEPYFKGFELYYKIYGQAESIDTYANTLDELKSKGFQRMNRKPPFADAILKPLIPVDVIDRDKQFLVTIDFTDFNDIYSSTENPKIYSEQFILAPFEILELRRNVKYSIVGRTDEFKRFSNEPLVSEFESADFDLSIQAWNDISDSSPGGPVKIVLFVLSYGYDPFSTNPEQYSQPVWLGSLENIYFPYP